MTWLVFALVWIFVAAALGILVGASIRAKGGQETPSPAAPPAVPQRQVPPNVALPVPRRAFDPDVAPSADVPRNA